VRHPGNGPPGARAARCHRDDRAPRTLDAAVIARGREGGLRPVVGWGGMVVFGLSFMVPIAPFGVFGSVFAGSRGQVVGAYLVGAGG
jgi:hypothetical protein